MITPPFFYPTSQQGEYFPFANAGGGITSLDPNQINQEQGPPSFAPTQEAVSPAQGNAPFAYPNMFMAPQGGQQGVMPTEQGGISNLFPQYLSGYSSTNTAQQEMQNQQIQNSPQLQQMNGLSLLASNQPFQQQATPFLSPTQPQQMQNAPESFAGQQQQQPVEGTSPMGLF
jgi:hypothetical protein